MRTFDTSLLSSSRESRVGLALFVMILFVSGSFQNTHAQWKLSTGIVPQYITIQNQQYLTTRYATTFANSGGKLYAGVTSYSGLGTDSLFVSNDNGLTWTAVAEGGGFPLLMNGNSIIASMGSALSDSLCYSTNLGKTWTPDTTNIGNHYSINCGIMVGSTAYLGVSGVWQQSTNALSTPWAPDTVGMNITGIGAWGIYSMLSVSSNALYAGTSNGGVFLSTNQGAPWVAMNNGLPLQNNDFNVVGLAAISNAIFAMVMDSTQGYIDIFRTTDGAQNWSQMNAQPLNWGFRQWINFSNASFISGSQSLFATTDSGVFVSNDQGATWTNYNTGLPPPVSTGGLPHFPAMIISGSNLVISTDSGGLFSRKLSDFGVSSVAADGSVPPALALSISENPASDKGTIMYSLRDAGTIQIQLMDELGRSVRMLYRGSANAGENQIALDPQSFVPGTYFVRVEAGSVSAMQKFVIER